MTTASVTLDSVSFSLADGRVVFSDLSATFDSQATGLVGRNGVGKSLLGQIISGRLQPSQGRCLRAGTVLYLAQQIDLPPDLTVAGLAGWEPVLAAVERIEAGGVDPADFDIVGERWDIGQRLQAALHAHGLVDCPLHRPARSLSGGQAMRVALTGAFLAEPDLLILDEPTNHLDRSAKAAFIEQLSLWRRGSLVISHDVKLLQGMTRILELSGLGLRSYGGNHDAYLQARTKEREDAARELDLRKRERSHLERRLNEQRERQERRHTHGANRAREANQAPILLGGQRQRSEQSAGKLGARQAATRETLFQRVREAAQRVEQETTVTLYSPNSARHRRQVAAELHALRLPFVPPSHAVPNLQIGMGQRIGVTGANGIGKSTLLKVMAGQLTPLSGECSVGVPMAYLDQRLCGLDPHTSVLAQLLMLNRRVSEGELRTRLAHLGLDAGHLAQTTISLSGGERLKAAMACALYRDEPAQLLLLDEPGNHLDSISLQALEQMLRQYSGALLVVSHDEQFLSRIELTHRLEARECGWTLLPWSARDSNDARGNP
jgi:ATPase subunit of ABC transporter with duplicated ATPase domains